MIRNVSSLAARRFDVLVIGGGIHGLAVAYDAAQRGVATALVDRGDFGSGSSFNHAKTVHGGLRSLQSGDVVKARFSILERRAMARIAPPLVTPLAFMMGTSRRALATRNTMRAVYGIRVPIWDRNSTSSCRILTRSVTSNSPMAVNCADAPKLRCMCSAMKPLTPGPEEARLRALAPPEAAFLGRVDDETLRGLYRGCRAVLMPGVEDAGIGIAPEHHERIFDKFFMIDGSISRRVGGTGVGLYLVREIARLHQGSVRVASAPGRGSCFELGLPRLAAGRGELPA